ncbi:MAG: hypothetical protein ABIK86_06955, partial [candidate division WOR-3 bacterium]
SRRVRQVFSRFTVLTESKSESDDFGDEDLGDDDLDASDTDSGLNDFDDYGSDEMDDLGDDID